MRDQIPRRRLTICSISFFNELAFVEAFKRLETLLGAKRQRTQREAEIPSDGGEFHAVESTVNIPATTMRRAYLCWQDLIAGLSPAHEFGLAFSRQLTSGAKSRRPPHRDSRGEYD